jgi:creatinase
MSSHSQDVALPQFKQIRNGAPVRRTFSDAEFARRQSALRTILAQGEVEAVLFTSIHNINYYSDFLYCSFGRPYGLLVTPDRAVSISANIDGGQPWRRTFGDNVVFTDWQRDNF